MWGYRAVDAGFVGDTLQDALDSTWRHADAVMDGKVSVNQRAYPVSEGNDTALGLRAVDSTLAIDHQPMILPVDVFARKSSQLGHSQAGIKQRPDNEALLVGLTC